MTLGKSPPLRGPVSSLSPGPGRLSHFTTLEFFVGPGSHSERQSWLRVSPSPPSPGPTVLFGHSGREHQGFAGWRADKANCSLQVHLPEGPLNELQQGWGGDRWAPRRCKSLPLFLVSGPSSVERTSACLGPQGTAGPSELDSL